MNQMLCKRTDCFYYANGHCVSIGVLSAEKCGHFLHKKQSRARPKPTAASLASIRARMEMHAPLFCTTVAKADNDFFFKRSA